MRWRRRILQAQLHSASLVERSRQWYDIVQLALIKEAEIKVLGEFIEKMKASQEGDHTLLDLHEQPRQLFVP